MSIHLQTPWQYNALGVGLVQARFYGPFYIEPTNSVWIEYKIDPIRPPHSTRKPTEPMVICWFGLGSWFGPWPKPFFKNGPKLFQLWYFEIEISYIGSKSFV